MKHYADYETREDYNKLTKILIENKLTITTMESATAGLIASLITDTEGSSAVLKGAFVTYSNEAKVKNGVPKETIDQFSVYSNETAYEMARACGEVYDADISIGVTGTFGNIDPANAENSVPGQVYFAVRYKDCITCYNRVLPQLDSRWKYKMAVAKEIVDILLSMLCETNETAKGHYNL